MMSTSVPRWRVCARGDTTHILATRPNAGVRVLRPIRGRVAPASLTTEVCAKGREVQAGGGRKTPLSRRGEARGARGGECRGEARSLEARPPGSESSSSVTSGNARRREVGGAGRRAGDRTRRQATALRAARRGDRARRGLAAAAAARLKNRQGRNKPDSEDARHGSLPQVPRMPHLGVGLHLLWGRSPRGSILFGRGTRFRPPAACGCEGPAISTDCRDSDGVILASAFVGLDNSPVAE